MIEFIKFLGFKKRLTKAMETHHRLEDPWSAAHVKPVIKKYLDDHAGEYKSAFEVGCGDGIITELLANQATEVDAIDISRRAIEKAKDKTYACTVSFTVKDIHSYFYTKNYDLVLLSFIVEYLGFDKFPKKFVHLIIQMTKHCNKIVIVQPVQGEENLKRLHMIARILNQFGFIEEHKEINTETSPDLFMGTYRKHTVQQ